MTELQANEEMTRGEIAEYLREFAAQLDTTEVVPESESRRGMDDDGRVTFMVGNDSATINPPETVRFEVEVDSDSSFMGGKEEHEVEFELTWQAEEIDRDEDEEELEIK